VDAAPEATPYTFLRARIFETYHLSDYEKWDMLVKMEPVGSRKPSQLLATIMEYCPAELIRPLPFHYYFTQCLRQALRTQLGETKHGDPCTLVARADRLWPMHVTGGAVVSAIDEVEPVGATNRDAGRGHNNSDRGGMQWGQGGRKQKTIAVTHSSGAATSGAPAEDTTLSALAKMSSVLCFFHWNFAEKTQ
jgi:hypothetical protein